MLITLLNVGDVSLGLRATSETLLNIENHYKNKEILGQIIPNIQARAFTGRVDPDKVSHLIKNIRYNHIAESLIADVETLPTPYGEHLKLCLDRFPHKVHFRTICIYDDINKEDNTIAFVTAHAIIEST
ncbi:MAG: hypothetical protein JWP44_5049 [Mucilaginibacter sp.]|nr:hypothetical protein [Mucilaginibacter sp.]